MSTIEKKELQDDGHYCISVYDKDKQELVARWYENKEGQKDGTETVYVDGGKSIKHLINWKNGKKDGVEEIYENINVLVGGWSYSDLEYNLVSKVVKRNVYSDGNFVQGEKISYPKKLDNDAIKMLNKSAFAEKAGIKVNHFSIYNPVIVRDDQTNQIKKISFDDLSHIWGGYGRVGCHCIYDMEFDKEGREYNGKAKIELWARQGVYDIEKGKLTYGSFNNGEEKGIRYYYKYGIDRIEYFGGAIETFSYNKDGKLDGPNNCVLNNAYHDHEMYKKCTYKNGKLDGEYKETPEYKGGGRTIECFYKEGILDGRYFEETKEHKIECNYKDGNLDGEYKEYVKTKDGSWKLSKEINYKDGVLDGKYVDSMSDLIYRNGKIVSGERIVNVNSRKTIYTYKNESEYKVAYYNGCSIEKMESFKDNKLDGIYADYEKDEFITYKEGKKNGKCRFKKEGGTVYCNYKDDILDGPYEERDKVGHKKCEGFYKDGQKEGIWKIYATDYTSSNGNVTAIETLRYEQGKDVTNRYNALKKVASKRIAEEDKISESSADRIILPRKSKTKKIIDIAIATIQNKLDKY